jgi:hypothetical protein
MNRQKLILALLLVALVGAIIYAVVRSPKQQRVATLKYRPGAVATVPRRGAAAAPTAAAAGQEVHLAQLDREQTRTSGYRRNIFTPIFHEEVTLPPFKPLPPPPRSPRGLPPPPPPSGGAGQGQMAPPPPPPPTPRDIDQQELSRFSFLGFLKKNGDKTVFLSRDNEIFLARKGATIANKFIVSDLTDDALTLQSPATGAELVIPLLDNQAVSSRRTTRRALNQ